MGEKVLERVRSNGQALLQNGMSYLQSGGSGSASITTRDLSDQITAPFDNQYTQQFTSSLKNAANTVTSQLPNPNQQLEDEDDALYRAQTQDDPEDDLDFDDGLESQKLARRDDKPVTGVLSDEISGVGAAGADMFKNVARFTSGGIRGLLDALSTVLVTTGEVGGHARSAFSSINKSGAGAISAVIDTGGNIVSGGLDKAGSVVGSLKVGGGGATPPKA
nr:SP29.0 [Bemisia tabaci]